MKRLFIVGCSGHGKVVADLAVKSGKYEKIVFLDDAFGVKECMGFSVVGNTAYSEFQKNDEVIVAIGNSEIRQRLLERYGNQGATIATLVHPDAVVGMNVCIGRGSVVMAGTVINSDSRIGEGVIINTAATVDHDNVVEDYAHIAVGAHLAGTVTVGRHTWIGAGAIVKNNLYLVGNVMVGAGGVVVKNIEEPGTYVGIPVKKL